MTTVAQGASQTFTASVKGATFTVATNGGALGTVSGATSAAIGPLASRRTFGPYDNGESITISILAGEAQVEYGDATPQSWGKDPIQSSVSGGGSALPTSVAFGLAWDTAGNKDRGTYTATAALAFTSDDSGSVVGGSTFAVVIPAGYSATFDGAANTGWLTGANNIVGLYRVGSTIIWTVNGAQSTRAVSGPVVPVAPVNTLPTIVTAVAGSALVWTGGGASGSPTPTTVYSWRTSSGTLVQDNITSGSYTPPAAGSFLLRMISTNSQGSDTDDVSVTVSAAATAPGAPTVSAATSITATGLTYTYADGSTGGSAITSRNADISFDGGTTWTAITAPTVGSNTITFASSGSARTAQIRARATNAINPGGYGTLTGIAVPAAAASYTLTPATAAFTANSGTISGSVLTSTAGGALDMYDGPSFAGDFHIAIRLTTPPANGVGGFELNLLNTTYQSAHQMGAPCAAGNAAQGTYSAPGASTGASPTIALTGPATGYILYVQRVGTTITGRVSADGNTTVQTFSGTSSASVTLRPQVKSTTATNQFSVTYYTVT